MEETFAISDVLALLTPGMMAGLGLGTAFGVLGYVIGGLFHLIDK